MLFDLLVAILPEDLLAQTVIFIIGLGAIAFGGMKGAGTRDIPLWMQWLFVGVGFLLLLVGGSGYISNQLDDIEVAQTELTATLPAPTPTIVDTPNPVETEAENLEISSEPDDEPAPGGFSGWILIGFLLLIAMFTGGASLRLTAQDTPQGGSEYISVDIRSREAKEEILCWGLLQKATLDGRVVTGSIATRTSRISWAGGADTERGEKYIDAGENATLNIATIDDAGNLSFEMAKGPMTGNFEFGTYVVDIELRGLKDRQRFTPFKRQVIFEYAIGKLQLIDPEEVKDA